MNYRMFQAAGLAAALFVSHAFAADMTPEQRAANMAKAETAARLVAYGQELKDPTLLRAAANLIAEVGPVAREVKDGKPINYDVEALLKEADGYGEGRAIDMSKASPNQCSWFYNCDSYNNCFWDQWC